MTNPSGLLSGYDTSNITIGVLGGHSALDICAGAKKHGFKTVAVVREDRKNTYQKYFKTRGDIGCVDEVIPVKKFEDVLQKDVQEKLRSMNTIFIHNRYFWVYFSDYSKVEKDFNVPIFGNREYVKLEERDQPYNQYHILQEADIRTPMIFSSPKDINRPAIVKAGEKNRRYERGFFLVWDEKSYEQIGTALERDGKIADNWREAVIEEFIVGAQVNFNFFYSPLTGELEIMGTDMRRQTNLDGFLRMTSDTQQTALQHMDLKMIETGHVAVTVKESILEKAFEMGEKFVSATKKIDNTGIIGPFALQGAVIAEEGKEDIVIFDVSMRIPGSPGTKATPYSGYLHGESMSYGERIALEMQHAIQEGKLSTVTT